MASKFDYLDARSTADELVQFFGMDAVLRREGSSPVDRPCRVAIVEHKPRERPTDLANPEDRYVIISAANAEVQAMPPDNEHDVLVTFVQPPTNPPVEHEILPFTSKPKVTAPAGIAVCYECTVRR